MLHTCAIACQHAVQLYKTALLAWTELPLISMSKQLIWSTVLTCMDNTSNAYMPDLKDPKPALLCSNKNNCYLSQTITRAQQSYACKAQQHTLTGLHLHTCTIGNARNRTAAAACAVCTCTQHSITTTSTVAVCTAECCRCKGTTHSSQP